MLIKTKDAVQSTAFLLHIAEDSKGKALSEADLVCVVANPAGITKELKNTRSSLK